MKVTKKLLCLAITAAMLVSTAVIPVGESEAAAKATLKTKKVTLTVGKTATIKINKKNKKANYKYSSSKKSVATVSKKGVITAKKAGTAKITVKETLKKKTRTLGKVTVTVAKPNSDIVVPVPATQVPVVTATPAPSATPVSTATPTATPTPESPYVPISEFLSEEFDAPAGFNNNVAANNGTVTKIQYPSTVIKEGETVMRNANICLPKNYDPNDKDKRYPVIYICHGIGGNEDGMKDCANVLWNAVAEGTAEEAILVCPSCCANEYNGAGSNPFFSLEHYAGYDNFLNDFKECLKPYIDENYNTLTDRENTAICGFSMGGRVTLHLGFALQDTFRYVGAFCPAPGILDFTDNGVTGPGLFTPETFKLEEKYADDTLVMIFKGQNDGTVKTFPQVYHDALVENEVKHTWYHGLGMRNDGSDGGGGHDGDVYFFGFYNFITRIFMKK